MYNQIISTWPYEFIVTSFFAFFIHCLLIYCAISYYNILWPDVLNNAQMIAQVYDEEGVDE